MNHIRLATEDENKIASVASWARIAAVCSLASAAIGVAIALTERVEVQPLVTFAIQLALGISLFAAAQAFRRAADDTRIVRGFLHLRRHFCIQAALVITAIVWTAMTMIAAPAIS